MGARTQISHRGRGLTSGNPCTQPRDHYPPANPANHLRCSDLAAKLQIMESNFAQRDRNKAAYLMARHTKDIVDCLIWVEDTSLPIVS